eukprot:TRINITY_DN27822_c0_g1_i2.p1 TRINITY_DN27822_c0_g1~~TRINITY_DN27822_c0_g1_i2.p1  ORF type:complete len:138 (+),score=23.70 TRINITY_DN27822_c0_g1_i2:145-558(+)
MCIRDRRRVHGTMKLLEGIPELLPEHLFGNAYFSVLGPNSALKPHSGPSNIKLRCHLTLDSPGDSYIRVGGDFRQWEEGKMLVFDESFSHEESNIDAEKERILLVFDIWHPDLIKEERDILLSGFKNLESHNATKSS